jgi:nucleoside-diphosphate-sugar epimerase
VSKTEAEKAAWDFREKNGGVDVVAVHPGTCLGELIQKELNASSAVLQRLMMGSEDTQECYWLGAVHVKDVARAHVLVYETPTAAGRYLCVNGIYQFSSFAKIVSELYPDFPIHRLVCYLLCFTPMPCYVMLYYVMFFLIKICFFFGSELV